MGASSIGMAEWYHKSVAMSRFMGGLPVDQGLKNGHENSIAHDRLRCKAYSEFSLYRFASQTLTFPLIGRRNPKWY